LDAQPITSINRESYRQLFSAVFDDVVLFDSLMGIDIANLDGQARDYLRELKLDRVVTVKDGVFSTTDLSRGQRKRLALLTAYLEDRPIYVFDEWAADQDPLFKKLFYLKLLPDIRSRGKAVVAITHDDRYFSAADRVIKLEDGRVADSSSEYARCASSLPDL
jgi:putative ATP-binding cassette transporter